MRTKVRLTGVVLALLLASSSGALAQQAGGAPDAGPSGAKPQGQAAARQAAPAPSPAAEEAARPEDDESTAITRPYATFLKEYRLGPEDVISITVFGHERYSKPNITIPPDGLLAYYLIPEGIQVAGKTTRQVAEELAKHLDEYIIDPKVTVTLEKAQSHQYGVLGEVGQPGIRLMTRRLTLYEALLQAGGVLGTGNKKKVVLVRRGRDEMLTQRVVDVAAIERGRAPDNVYLEPGDQVFVPGNRMKTVNKVLELLPVVSFARIFTGGW